MDTQTPTTTTDPTPWRHTSGVRVADILAEGAPIGGYTFDPRPGYSDHPLRYISTRKQKD